MSLLRTHAAALAAKLPWSPLSALLAIQGRLGTLQGKILLSLEDRGTRLLLAAGMLCVAPVPLILVYRAGRRPPSPTPMIEEVSAELAEELLSAYAAETAAKPVDPRSPAAESPQTVTEAELQSPPPAAATTPTERRLHGVAEHLQAEVAQLAAELAAAREQLEHERAAAAAAADRGHAAREQLDRERGRAAEAAAVAEAAAAAALARADACSAGPSAFFNAFHNFYEMRD